MVFVCVKEQQLQKVQDLVPTLLLSHPAVTVTWQLVLSLPLQMFPFMAGIFYFPLPPMATQLEGLQKGEAMGLHQEKPAVYSYLKIEACLTGTRHPGCSRDSLRDRFDQKRVLCLSGCRSTDVIVVVNIFLAQGSDKLGRRKLQPCDLVVPVSSWLLCLVLPGTQEKGWP